MTKNSHTIDATGRSVGRIASEAAKALMGKMSASYTPHIRSDVHVTIFNAGKVSVREKKQVRTVLTHYTGFHGGLRKTTPARLAAKSGHGAVIRLAVRRMLPRNTMLTARLKNLTITE